MLWLKDRLPAIPTSPGFRTLWMATTVSEFGDWSARIAIAALIFEQTGNAALVGLVSVVFVAPRLGIGQVLTSWAERLPRAPLLITSDLARALVFLILALIEFETVPLLALVFVAATIDPVFQSNAAASTFDLLSDDDRDDGVRLRQLTIIAAQIAGISLSGVLLGWFSPQIVLLLNVASFVLSAVLVGSTPIKQPTGEAESVAKTIAGAIRVVVNQAHIRGALLTTVIAIFAATAAEAQVVVLAESLDQWVLPAAGAAVPLGTGLATAVARTDGGTRQVIRRGLAVMTLSMAVAIAALALENSLFAAIAYICVGLMFLPVAVGQVIAVRHLPTKGRASVLSLLQTVVLIGAASGAAVSGLAINQFGTTRGLQLCLLVAVAGWFIPLPDEEPESETVGEAASDPDDA